MRTLSLTIQFDPARLSVNRVSRGSAFLHREAKRLAVLATLSAWSVAGHPERWDVPVVISAVVFRATRCDEGAVREGLKAIVDFLCGAQAGDHYHDSAGKVRWKMLPGRLVPDDSPEWVTLGEVRIVVARANAGRERVIVTVREQAQEGGAG